MDGIRALGTPNLSIAKDVSSTNMAHDGQLAREAVGPHGLDIKALQRRLEEVAQLLTEVSIKM